MIVVKFGGTSVGDADAIRRAAEIVQGRLHRNPLVVVSALGGATNALLAIGEQSARGHLIGALRGVESLRDRHLGTCSALLSDVETCDDVSGDLSAMIDELAHLAEALKTLGEASPRSFDTIAAYGELLSSHLVAAYFRAAGIPAELVDARDVMITNDNFMEAAPVTDAIADRSRDVLQPLLASGKVPVLGGFIGRTLKGATTTLGRGGSDYSASLLGAALHAEAIEIWTDVDGMLTADPRRIAEARLIEEIRFDEASELASFGAKVLHPGTIVPAVRLGIPVFIYNSGNPSGRGTRITFDAPRRDVTAIAGRKDVTVVRVQAPRMLFARGFLRNVFDVFERHRTSADVVATSEVSISVSIDETARLDDLLIDMRRLGDVAIERNRGIVAVVGSGIGEATGAMSRVFAALGDIRVHMLSLSSTGINLTLVVDGSSVDDAVQRLHHEFFPDEFA